MRSSILYITIWAEMLIFLLNKGLFAYHLIRFKTSLWVIYHVNTNRLLSLNSFIQQTSYNTFYKNIKSFFRVFTDEYPSFIRKIALIEFVIRYLFYHHSSFLNRPAKFWSVIKSLYGITHLTTFALDSSFFTNMIMLSLICYSYRTNYLIVSSEQFVTFFTN